MDERRTGLDVDPAIAQILDIDPAFCKMQDHGDACSSEPFKITAKVNGEQRLFFAKIGNNGEMFKGTYCSSPTRLSSTSDMRQASTSP
jgi:hypothetical protein